VTSRCCAPSCRSRSTRRRSESEAFDEAGTQLPDLVQLGPHLGLQALVLEAQPRRRTGTLEPGPGPRLRAGRERRRRSAPASRPTIGVTAMAAVWPAGRQWCRPHRRSPLRLAGRRGGAQGHRSWRRKDALELPHGDTSVQLRRGQSARTRRVEPHDPERIASGTRPRIRIWTHTTQSPSGIGRPNRLSPAGREPAPAEGMERSPALDTRTGVSVRRGEAARLVSSGRRNTIATPSPDERAHRDHEVLDRSPTGQGRSGSERGVRWRIVVDTTDLRSKKQARTIARTR
jgi:hypothetical protein